MKMDCINKELVPAVFFPCFLVICVVLQLAFVVQATGVDTPIGHSSVEVLLIVFVAVLAGVVARFDCSNVVAVGLYVDVVTLPFVVLVVLPVPFLIQYQPIYFVFQLDHIPSTALLLMHRFVQNKALPLKSPQPILTSSFSFNLPPLYFDEAKGTSEWILLNHKQMDLSREKEHEI